MKIERIEIYNFRSIGEKCTINFDSKSTILVGKSNVGKTNILNAISLAFNDSPIDISDRCSWSKNDSLFAQVFLKVGEKDIAEITEIDSGLSKITHIIINKKLSGEINIGVSPDTLVEKWSEPSQEVKDRINNLRARTRRVIRAFKTIKSNLEDNDQVAVGFADLQDFVEKQQKLYYQDNEKEQKACLQETTKLLKYVRGKLNQKQYQELKTSGIKRSLSYSIQDIKELLPLIKFEEVKYTPLDWDDMVDLLPNIVFVDSRDELEITANIPLDEIGKTAKHNFIRGLIDISGIDLEILRKGERRDCVDPLIKANQNITDRLSKYWNQEDIKIELGIDWDTKSQPQPRKIVEIDFITGDGRRCSILEQSPGTRWFLAFVVQYLVNYSGITDTILLLDEPGIRLHAGAQKDLIARFEQTMDNVQILYTTHSPYMLNKNYPLRIRCVEKGNGINNKTRGTYVIQKPYHSMKSRSWEPIRSSIGISLGDSLYVGGANLIVEGITDQIILSGIIQIINELGATNKYDLNNVAITFAGNHSNLISLAIFCYEELKDVKVLLDSDIGNGIKTKMERGGVPKSQINILDDVLSDKSKIDIEDLFEPDFYHECVLRAYKKLNKYVSIFKLPRKWEDIEKEASLGKNNMNWGHSKYYEEYFKKRAAKSNELGDFNKVMVSQEIIANIHSLNESRQREIIRPFEKLINKIWAQSPSWF